MEERYRKKEEG